MANEVEIKLKATDDASQVLKKTEGNVKSLSETVERTNSSFKGGKDATAEYTSGLDKLEESGGTTETRFLGLGAGISGVNSLMQGGEPEDYAMAFADLGDAVEHTVAPALKAVKGGISSLIEQMGGLKSAALATGIAIGAAGLVLALKQYNDAADEARGKDLAEEFERTGKAAEQLKAAAEGDVFAMGDLSNAFGHLLEESPALAQAFLDQAEAAGIDAEIIANAQRAIDEVADSSERAAESVDALSEAYQAQIDPVFGAINAQRNMEEAHRAEQQAQDDVASSLVALNEAIHEFGRRSDEAKEAEDNLTSSQHALTEAQWATVDSAAEVDSSLLNLQAAVERGDVSVAGMTETLRQWVQDGRITAAQAERVRQRLVNVASAAGNVPGRISTTVIANTANAMERLRQIGLRIQQLDGSTINVNVNARATSTGRIGGVPIFGHGGIVGAAAAGGVRSGMQLVGEFGPELVSLAPGSTVRTAGDTKTAMTGGMGRSPVVVNNYIQGSIHSEKDIERIMKNALMNGAFRGLVGSTL